MQAGTMLGPYRVVRLLGKGGMGVVYEATHATLGRRVAVKVLRPELSADADRATRFVQEAQVVNLVDHPGLVQMVDLGQTAEGTPYIVMELLRGMTLGARLKEQGGKMPWPDAVRHTLQIAEVLQAAHEKSIVHRDLKPDNVMLVPDPQLPQGERVKLLDFGIAKLIDDANAQFLKTKTGALLGSPAYMSPEQCAGHGRIGVQSDVYSLGIVLYELLAGSMPLLGDGAAHMLVLHMFSQPRPLRPLRPDLPDELYAVIDRMLAKDPGARPTANQLVESLRALSHRGSGGLLGQGAVRRRRLLGVTAAAVLLGALAAYALRPRPVDPGPLPAADPGDPKQPAGGTGTSEPPRQTPPPTARPATTSRRTGDAASGTHPSRPTSQPSAPTKSPSELDFAPVDVQKRKPEQPLNIRPVR